MAYGLTRFADMSPEEFKAVMLPDFPREPRCVATALTRVPGASASSPAQPCSLQSPHSGVTCDGCVHS
jgi:hypothetical protein